MLFLMLWWSGGVYNELCYCPQPSLSKWLSAMQCPSSYEQITRDLSQFGKIDMTTVAKTASDRFSSRGAHSLCHYVIKDNKVIKLICFHLMRIDLTYSDELIVLLKFYLLRYSCQYFAVTSHSTLQNCNFSTFYKKFFSMYLSSVAVIY